MKSIFILLISISYMILPCKAQDDKGFTDKKEAKNIMKDSLKEGKWFEYITKDGHFAKDTGEAICYRLTVYKAGQIVGILRQYYKSGKLWNEIPYTGGKANGLAKGYFESGKLQCEFPFKDDKIDGTLKVYYENGNPLSETTYKEGKKSGLSKEYYESGKLKSEVPYTDGAVNGDEKGYYETGKLNMEIFYMDGKPALTKVYDENGKVVN